jgi:hypothetical protein
MLASSMHLLDNIIILKERIITSGGTPEVLGLPTPIAELELLIPHFKIIVIDPRLESDLISIMSIRDFCKCISAKRTANQVSSK